MTPNSSKKSIRFALDDVEIQQVDKISVVENPLVSSNWISINANEFSMTVGNVGSFYARDGNYIEYTPDEKADLASLELYMNGSVYGAILHQRRVLPLHGSSFIFNNSGVMFCGESGSGKSSLTASFCFEGADFLTDDVTPILFQEDKTHIWPKSGRIKLWDDSLQQLGKEKKELTKIRPEDEKYYLPINSDLIQIHPLHYILILQITGTNEVTFEKVEKVEAFSYLHQEIYRREYLGAMPKTEAAYLEQISTICNEVNIFKVRRPASIGIIEMQEELKNFLSLYPR